MIAFDPIQNIWLKHEEAPIDPGVIAIGLLLKPGHSASFEMNCAIAPGRLNRRQGGLAALLAVMGNQGGHVHIRHPIAIGETEAAAIQIGAHTRQATTCLALIPRIHQRHLPGFALALVHLHVVIDVHMERDITGVQEIIGEILLDQIALITAADNKLVNAKMAINFENVPENRLASYLHHRLWLEVGFFAEAGTESASKDNCFHLDYYKPSWEGLKTRATLPCSSSIT